MSWRLDDVNGLALFYLAQRFNFTPVFNGFFLTVLQINILPSISNFIIVLSVLHLCFSFFRCGMCTVGYI